MMLASQARLRRYAYAERVAFVAADAANAKAVEGSFDLILCDVPCSGTGTLALKDKVVTLAGAIKADRAYFELPATRPDMLGDDVVVRGRERRPTDASQQRVPFAVDVELDFGDQLTFVGQGFNSGLAGKLHVRTTASRQRRS